MLVLSALKSSAHLNARNRVMECVVLCIRSTYLHLTVEDQSSVALVRDTIVYNHLQNHSFSCRSVENERLLALASHHATTLQAVVHLA